MSEKKLWMVYVETQVCVLASTQDEAAQIALDNAEEEMHHATADADEITRRSALAGWEQCLPWGGDGDKTTDQLCDEMGIE